MYGMMATNIAIPEQQKKRGSNSNCADITKYFTNPKIVDPSIHNATSNEELQDYFKRSCAPLDLSQPGNIYQRTAAIHDPNSNSDHQVELANKWQTARDEHECDNMMKYVYKDDMNMERIERQIFQDLDSRMCHGLDKSVEMVQNPNQRMYENALTIKYGREMKMANELHNNLYAMPQELKQDVINDKTSSSVNNSFNIMLSHNRSMHNREDLSASIPKNPPPNNDCLYSESHSYKWVPDLNSSLDEFKLPENEMRDQRQELISLVNMDNCPASLPMESCNRPTDPLTAKGNMYIPNEMPPQNNTSTSVTDEQNVQVISYEEFLKSEGLSVPSKDKTSDPNIVSSEPVIKKQSNIRKFFTRVPRTVEVKFDHKRLVTVTAVVHPQPQSPHKLTTKKPVKKNSPRRLSTTRQQASKHIESPRTTAQFSYNMRRRKSNVVVDIEEIDLTIKELNAELPDATKKPWRPGRRRLRSCQSFDGANTYDQLSSEKKNSSHQDKYFNNVTKNVSNNWSHLNAMYPKPQFLACDLPSPKRRRKKRSKSESCKDEMDSFDENPVVTPYNNVRKSRILYNCRKSARLNPDIKEELLNSELNNNINANHLHKPLRSIYKSTVIQKDANGLKLKFTRIGKKRHHHHHQHQHHKKHKSAKVQKAMELLQRAKESSIHRDTRIDDGLRRSTRQSSVMVRKAMEGARKAEELRQARITAQRMTSPRKRLRPRRVENNTLTTTRLNSHKNLGSEDNLTTNKGPVKLASIFTQNKKKEILSKYKKTEKIISAKELEAKQTFLKSGIPESLQQQIAKSQQHLPVSEDLFPFPTVSHVQQKKDPTEHPPKKTKAALKMMMEDCVKASVATVSANNAIHLGSLTTISGKVSECYKSQIDKLALMTTTIKHFPKKAIKQMLANIHQNALKIPVGMLYKNYLLKCQRTEKTEEAFWNIQDKEFQSKRSIECINVNEIDGMEQNDLKRQKIESIQPVQAKGLNTKKKDDDNDLKSNSHETNKQQEAIKQFEKSTWLWTVKYQPTHSSDIIGNQKSVQQLKTWLIEWKEQSKYEMKKNRESVIRGKRNSTGIDSDEDSDFALSDNSDDDYDNTMCNTFLVTGPSGIGKTATIYALAEELGYKVFEVNGSSRRTGKHILTELKEATQSHQVTSKGKSPKSFFQPQKKDGKDSKSETPKAENNNLTNVSVVGANSEVSISLVIFEDVDLIFENDDGFWAAVNTLMSNTKRPIILTSSSEDSVLCSKIKGRYEQLKFQIPNTRTTAVHMQILCLVENIYTSFDCIHNLVLYNDGNIRKTILDLQYWALSGGDRRIVDDAISLPLCGSSSHEKTLEIASVDAKDNVELLAENSIDTEFFESLQFLKEEDAECIEGQPLHTGCLESICGLTIPATATSLNSALKTTNSRLLTALVEQCHSVNIDVTCNNLPFLLPLPIDILHQNKKPSISIVSNDSASTANKSKVLDLSWISDEDDDGVNVNQTVLSTDLETTISADPKLSPQERQTQSQLCQKTSAIFSQLADNLSDLDSIYGSHHLEKKHDCWKWWYRECTCGLSDEIDEEECENGLENLQEIKDNIAAQSIALCSEKLASVKQDKKYQDEKICKPLMIIPTTCRFLPKTKGLKESQRCISYHHIKSHLSHIIQLCHDNIVVDYLPHLRRICQSEKNRQLSNTKRGGRFLHYLDAMSLPSSVLDQLCGDFL